MSVNNRAWQWFSLICFGVLCALVVQMAQMNQRAGSGTHAAHDHAEVLRELDVIRQEVAELRARADDHTGQAAETAETTLSQRVAALESMARPDHSAFEVPSGHRPGAHADQQVVQTAHATALPDREQEIREEAERFESIDRNHAGQTVDPEWSALASDTISYGLAQPGEFPISITNVDCRSTACRVELRVDEHVSNDDVLMAIPPETRITFPRLAMRGGDEDPTTRVVYLGSDEWTP